MTIALHLKTACDRALDELMQEVKGIKAVVVSTEDGFEVAARVENTAQIARLSAMASSLAALGAMAGEESRLGVCESLIMEAAEGFIAIIQVRRADVSLIVSVVTGRDAVTGQVLYFSKKAARMLQDA
jgi:predicted regulator of Ras-like GTPase activity (Roadblock/LC7/MglB family)